MKQTALFHAYRECGATVIEHHDWHVPAFFTSPDAEAARVRESVGLADVSWMLKFDLQGQGLKDPPSFGEQTFSWKLGQLHYLVTCESPSGEAIRDRFQQVQNTQVDPSLPLPFYVTEVTSVYAQVWLAGPQSREVLNKLTSLNLANELLPNMSCAQASVAHVPAIILRQDSPELLGYHLLIGRDYGESVWESLMHAGREFRIAPFGLQAQRLLHG